MDNVDFASCIGQKNINDSFNNGTILFSRLLCKVWEIFKSKKKRYNKRENSLKIKYLKIYTIDTQEYSTLWQIFASKLFLFL